MNFAAFSLSMLIIGLCPKAVHAYDIHPLLLFDRPSSLFDLAEAPGDMISAMMRRHDEHVQSSMASSLRGSYFSFPSLSAASPCYEVINNEEKFQLAVNIPGAKKADDVDVKFDERSRMLTVSGYQETHDEESGFHSSSQFSRSFSLDPFVVVDQMAATMDQGVLTITAPKSADKIEQYLPIRSIPVTTLLDGDEEKKGKELPVAANSARRESYIPAYNPNDVLANPMVKKNYKTSELR